MNKKTEQHNHIDQLARKAAAGTLKRIYTASANDNIRKLQLSLQADFSAMDNNKPNYIISEAYDLYTLAYSYLYEKIVVDGLTDQTEITLTQKNGNMYNITVFQATCKAVSKAVYANKALNIMSGIKTHIRKDGTKATYKTINKQVYIEDLGGIDDNGNSALDREYIRINGLYSIDQYAVNEQTKELLNSLSLSDRQASIIALRLQGYSVTTIAEKIGVSQQAISKQLAAVQNKIEVTNPELIRGFKGQRSR